MSALLTQCPHCNTSFRVSVAQQNAAGGLVRCGSCLAVFSASDNEIRIKQPGQELDFASREPDEADGDNADAYADSHESAETADTESLVHAAAAESFHDEAFRDESFREESVHEESVHEESAHEESVHEEEAAKKDEPAPTAEADYPAEIPLSPEIIFTLEEARPEPGAAAGLEPAAEEEFFSAFLPEVEKFEPDDDIDEDPDTAVVDAESAAAHTSAVTTPEAGNPLFSDRAREEQANASDTGAMHDEVIISLGDMQLDENPEDHGRPQGPVATEGGAEHETGQGQEIAQQQEAGQRSSAHDKLHVREYLSALADDELLEPLDDSQLEELDEEPLSLTARKQRSFGMSLLLFSANLLLVAGLIAQWTFWNRATLDDNPRFRFLAPYVCQVFSCPAPAPLPASNALSSRQLLVRTHPRFPDALELSFIFNNDATTSQPFPNLELAFSDINNQLLANRLFTPSEYLPMELQQFEAMPPQTSVQVVIELVDPGEDAVNYNISFHDP